VTRSNDIIDSLVADLQPVPRHALQRRFAIGIAVGLGISFLIQISVFGYRHDMPYSFLLPAFWMKSVYNAALALTGFFGLFALAHPDGSAHRSFLLAAAIFVVMAAIGMLQLSMTPVESHHALIMGVSSLHCPFLILGFALPVFAGNVWILRRAAPTNLRLAGFVAGLAAGAAGAWVYSWFCNENGMAFVAIWYTLGILLCGLLGALSGKKLLRW
jgi:hypothetical protein